MKRRLALLLFGIACVAPAATPSAGAAVVCPLITSNARAVTCCGPPSAAGDAQPAYPCCAATETAQAICCPPNALCVVPLTITSSADPSTAGDHVTISGKLSSGGAGQQIKLWQKLAGQQKFSQIAQTNTDSTGAYTFSSRPETNREWYVASGSQTSVTLAQQVRARVKLRASKSSVPVGQKATLSGTVIPEHTGQHVLIQRLVAGQWQTVAQPRLRHAHAAGRSRFKASVTVTSAGTWQLRAELEGDTRNITSVSTSISITG